MKILIITILSIGILVIVTSLILTTGHQNHIKIIPKTNPSNPHKIVSLQQVNNPLSLYPKTSFNCNTNASLVDLSSDYTVDGMNCSDQNITAGNFLSCNGTIFQHATNVSLLCYRSNYYTSSDLLQCNGTADGMNNPTNLSLSYTCVLSNQNGSTLLYTCNGSILGYSSFAVSLPMNIACNSV